MTDVWKLTSYPRKIEHMILLHNLFDKFSYFFTNWPLKNGNDVLRHSLFKITGGHSELIIYG